jgi:hypothetical protein
MAPARTLLIAFFLGIFSFATAAYADTIYDAKIEQKLKLDDAQKPKVAAIVQKTRSDMNIVFQKYGIDPDARPSFDLLQKAGEELQDIQHRERRELKAILKKDQLKQYDKIVEQTSATVRKAAK